MTQSKYVDKTGKQGAAFSIPELRAAVSGRVITPEDSDYDQARTVFYGGFDRRPAAIVRAANAGDVAHVVSLAGENGVELAVRGGGHSTAGHSTTEGGIVLDLRDMRGLEIDVENRTAWAEAGLTAGDVTAAAAEHGLVIGFGDTGSVGIGGITLGGGVGFLVRKYGLTIDNLLAVEMVTADGQLRRADAKNHPDLFWAIRGGGGNFGVVTRFKYQLHELGQVLGGMLILPATPEVIAGVMAEGASAPEELSMIVNVMSAPPMPFLPKEVHGKLIVLVMPVYAGPPEEGERVLAPIRALAEPLADMVKPMRYADMFQPEEGEGDYHPSAVSHNMYVNHVDRQMAQTMLDFIKASDAPMRVAQLRPLGGAAARVPVEATAYAHRRSPVMVNVAAFFMGADDRAKREAWVADFAAALDQGDTGVYVNFMAEEDPERVRAAYPGETWERLTQIKTKYDPTNLFRLNQNITPANGR
jgi:hypothetical protein